MTGRPIRIQRRRVKGWRMPPNTVCVSRPSIWGNPGLTVEQYRAWMTPHVAVVRERLAGKNLACWCPLDRPCHADMLLELANP